MDGDDDEIYVTGLIAAATAYAEEAIGRGLVTQTWQQWVAPNPYSVRLEVGNFASLTDVSYYDADNVLQAATLGDFDVRLGRDRVGLYAAAGATWPTAYNRADAIRLTYTVGGDASDVLPDVKHAILMLVGHWYENREAVTDLKLSDTPMAVNALLGMHRVGWYG